MIFFGRRGVEADADNVHKAFHLFRHAATCDKLCLAVGVHADGRAYFLQVFRHFKKNVQRIQRLAETAENRFFDFPFFKLGNNLFCRRFFCEPKIIVLDSVVISPQTKGAVVAALVCKVYISFVVYVIDNGVIFHFNLENNP